MFQHDSTCEAHRKDLTNSHYPYSCYGEGRQADRQDDPGSHWAGSELALSQAWGERVASGWRGDTTGGDEVRSGWGRRVTNTQENTQGGT